MSHIPLQLVQLLSNVSRMAGVSSESVKCSGKRANRDVQRVRMVFCCFARQQGYSLEVISQLLHCSVSFVSKLATKCADDMNMGDANVIGLFEKSKPLVGVHKVPARHRRQRSVRTSTSPCVSDLVFDSVLNDLNQCSSFPYVTASEIKGDCRRRHLVVLRQCMFVVLHKCMGYSLSKVGEVMNRTSGTVLIGANTALQQIEVCKESDFTPYLPILNKEYDKVKR